MLPTIQANNCFISKRPNKASNRRVSISVFICLITLAPISVHAALPESVVDALSKAELALADISIMVVPIGDKNTSRLPPVVNIANHSDSTDKDETSTVDQSTLPTIVSQKGIVSQEDTIQQERELNTETDDLYAPSRLDPLALSNNNINNVYDSGDLNHVMTDNSLDNTGEMDSVSSDMPSLITHYPDTARTPASTMKLIPSFIALDSLGADFVWHTRVYHTGLIIGDRLQGDLIIQGSGDPKMTHERVRQLLYQVQKSGVRHIDGDIIIDSTIFDHVTKDPAAFDNEPLRPYNASPDGFLVNFSTIGIRSYPAVDQVATLTYKPMLAHYQLPTLIGTRDAVCSSASSSLAPEWRTDQLLLTAMLPEQCVDHVFYVAYPDAKDFAVRVIASKWQQLGNTLSGQVRAQDNPYQATKRVTQSISPLPIASYPSLNLTQQIYDINHFSNNVMTEQLALSLGAYSPNKHDGPDRHDSPESMSKITMITKRATSLYNFGAPNVSDYTQALGHIDAWWRTHLSTAPPYLTNGSGLCRDCTLTAANLSELLSYAYKHPSFDAYVNSLGIAGVSGTISSHSERLPQSAAIGRAWIKTGTLSNVTAMAGYVKGQSGQDYALVGIINTEQTLNSYTARPVLDALLDWTAQQ